MSKSTAAAENAAPYPTAPPDARPRVRMVSFVNKGMNLWVRAADDKVLARADGATNGIDVYLVPKLDAFCFERVEHNTVIDIKYVPTSRIEYFQLWSDLQTIASLAEAQRIKAL
jgi:hypothetical protein